MSAEPFHVRTQIRRHWRVAFDLSSNSLKHCVELFRILRVIVSHDNRGRQFQVFGVHLKGTGLLADQGQVRQQLPISPIFKVSTTTILT